MGTNEAWMRSGAGTVQLRSVLAPSGTQQAPQMISTKIKAMLVAGFSFLQMNG
ncbi:hypothetical protein NC652_039497 [Populus alba x Populus x berolinensis]|nr:hypothetical protein NC652_039497 [Populus alba x Populus x berolinensis]